MAYGLYFVSLCFIVNSVDAAAAADDDDDDDDDCDAVRTAARWWHHQRDKRPGSVDSGASAGADEEAQRHHHVQDHTFVTGPELEHEGQASILSALVCHMAVTYVVRKKIRRNWKTKVKLISK